MKTLYLIGGPMGVGKSAVGQCLKRMLPRAVLLDGDWCWDADPFVVTEETKRMVLSNIRFLLNSFLRCSEYESVVFCWVMHRQEIIEDILSGLDLSGCRTVSVSLTASPEALRARLGRDPFFVNGMFNFSCFNPRARVGRDRTLAISNNTAQICKPFRGRF